MYPYPQHSPRGAVDPRSERTTESDIKRFKRLLWTISRPGLREVLFNNNKNSKRSKSIYLGIQWTESVVGQMSVVVFFKSHFLISFSRLLRNILWRCHTSDSKTTDRLKWLNGGKNNNPCLDSPLVAHYAQLWYSTLKTNLRIKINSWPYQQ